MNVVAVFLVTVVWAFALCALCYIVGYRDGLEGRPRRWGGR